MPKENKNLKFEEALEKLEQMVTKLEEGNLPLDDSLKFFQEGMDLARFCEHKLNEAQGKIEGLLKKEGEGPDEF